MLQQDQLFSILKSVHRWKILKILRSMTWIGYYDIFFWIVNFYHFKFAKYLQVCYSQQSGFVNIIYIFNQWKHF